MLVHKKCDAYLRWLVAQAVPALNLQDPRYLWHALSLIDLKVVKSKANVLHERYPQEIVG
jgi:hypothetical protein